MKINLNKVFERDIDLFIIDEFISNKKFASLFSSKIGIDDYKIIKISHSLFDIKYGESDITIIIENKFGNKVAILIENKIDAIAMSNQGERYFKRGEKGLVEKEYDEFHVFIIAPENYLKSNEESKKYPNRVSYEEILSFLESQNDERLSLKIILFKEALHKKKIGYQVIEDRNVTNFWMNYYQYQEINFPKLQLPKQTGPRGSSAIWPVFNTYYKKIKIYHKSDKGYVDLSFSNYGENIKELNNKLEELLDDDMAIVRTNKSAVVRIKTKPINFNENFELLKKDVHNALEIVERLELLAKKINYFDLYEK